MALAPGTRLGPYEILHPIGAGGMAEVYKATDTRLDRAVAIKVLHSTVSGDHDRQARFEREAKTVAGLAHPHICALYDVGEFAGSLFLVMEHLDGETLACRLEQGPLPIDQAFTIITEIADALSAAHREGIIHRDLKPANVMLTKSGVKLLDFGLAKLMGHGEVDAAGPPVSASTRSAALTGQGGILGTPDYMSPEQIEGGAVAPATDVFALGVVLYEMVTGTRPFAAATPLASALRRISGPPPQRPAELVRDIPAGWDGVIMRCLDPLPGNRFADAASVVSALKADEGTRRPRLSPHLTAALAVAVMLGAVGGTYVWLERKAERAGPGVSRAAIAAARPAVAVLDFRNLASREDTQWLSVALAEMLTTELGAGETLRIVPGENVGRMKMELALADANSYGDETLARMTGILGTDFLVLGSYVTVGDGGNTTLRVDVRLQDARGRQTMAAFSETGKAADLLGIVSRAGGRLRERLGVETKQDATASIRASEPTSPEAARLYAEGLMRLRRFDAMGARELLERAIQVDPRFPLARSALASAWSALGYDERARQSAERAFELSSNLPRAHRLQVEGTYRDMARSWKEAIAVWRSLETLFPDDVEHTLRLANAQIRSGAPKEAMATIDNFRNRFPATEDPRLDLMAASAAETLSDFKGMQMMAAEAVASGEAQGARLLVARAKLSLGNALWRQGRSEEAAGLFEEARVLYAAAGDQVGVARALNGSGSALLNGPDPRLALTLYEEGLAIARTAGNQDLTARFLNNIAILRRRSGDLQASLRLNQESLAIRRELDDRTNAAISLNNIGNVLLDLGDLKSAADHYEQSAALGQAIGDRQGFARALFNASESLKLQGQLARARQTNEGALKIRRSIEDPASVASSLAGLASIATLQGDLDTARRSLTEALEINRRLEFPRQVAYAVYGLGELSLIEGDLAVARRHHEEALALRTELGEKGTGAESRAALAAIALEQGRAADAESLAQEAAVAFGEEHAVYSEASARATVALAMVAQGKHSSAVREMARARALVRNTQHALTRMQVAIAAARIQAVDNAAAALHELEAVRSEAVERGIPRYEFEARRAIADIEGHGSAVGAAHLASLRQDAKARGFLLYAR